MFQTPGLLGMPTINVQNSHQMFFGHGKLLLTGEYFVLDGADAIALPVKGGQSLSVRYVRCYDDPVLFWKSYDMNHRLWFEARFEFWHFNCLDDTNTPQVAFLQRILRQARKQNPHFLREEMDVFVESHLGFPLEWGLGSSSTLVYNIAQWAYVGPFNLLFSSIGGSGYDIACAQSKGPILYSKKGGGPSWHPVYFMPPFKDRLYFIYLGHKQDSRESVANYQKVNPLPDPGQLMRISNISQAILHTNDLEEFEELIAEHERIVADALKVKRIKETMFSDYWGEIKSLGAWGGDFILATSDRSFDDTRNYFTMKNLDIIIPYSELIMNEHSEDSLYGTVH